MADMSKWKKEIQEVRNYILKKQVKLMRMQNLEKL